MRSFVLSGSTIGPEQFVSPSWCLVKEQMEILKNSSGSLQLDCIDNFTKIINSAETVVTEVERIPVEISMLQFYACEGRYMLMYSEWAKAEGDDDNILTYQNEHVSNVGGMVEFYGDYWPVCSVFSDFLIAKRIFRQYLETETIPVEYFG